MHPVKLPAIRIVCYVPPPPPTPSHATTYVYIHSSEVVILNKDFFRNWRDGVLHSGRRGGRSSAFSSAVDSPALAGVGVFPTDAAFCLSETADASTESTFSGDAIWVVDVISGADVECSNIREVLLHSCFHSRSKWASSLHGIDVESPKSYWKNCWKGGLRSFPKFSSNALQLDALVTKLTKLKTEFFSVQDLAKTMGNIVEAANRLKFEVYDKILCHSPNTVELISRASRVPHCKYGGSIGLNKSVWNCFISEMGRSSWVCWRGAHHARKITVCLSLSSDPKEWLQTSFLTILFVSETHAWTYSCYSIILTLYKNLNVFFLKIINTISLPYFWVQQRKWYFISFETAFHWLSLPLSTYLFSLTFTTFH